MKKVNLSYLKFENNIDKSERVKRCASGFQALKCYFSDLERMLQTDSAYSNFIFENGKRNLENVKFWLEIGFIPVDVDESKLSIDEVHSMLIQKRINHIIATTSNSQNLHKFRILLEIEPIFVEDNLTYKLIYNDLKNLLSDRIIIDELSASQIYFSYQNSYIKSFYAGKPLIIDIKKLKEQEQQNQINKEAEMQNQRINRIEYLHSRLTENDVNRIIESLGYSFVKDGTYMKFAISPTDTNPSANAYFSDSCGKVKIKNFSSKGEFANFNDDILGFLMKVHGYRFNEAVDYCYRFL